MMITRRGFLQSILIAGVAPAIVRAESIMQIAVPKEIILPSKELLVPLLSEARIFTVWTMSDGYTNAQMEGLLELRRYRDFRGFEMADFALPKAKPTEIKKLII